VLVARRSQSQAGQSFLPSSAYYTLPLTWKQPYNRTTTPSFPAVRSGIAVLPICRLTTPAFNAAHTGNTCFNYRKLGYCLPDYLLPCVFCAKLKELKKLLESNLKNNKHLTNKTGKNTF
jgi:hypothetical protein